MNNFILHKLFRKFSLDFKVFVLAELWLNTRWLETVNDRNEANTLHITVDFTRPENRKNRKKHGSKYIILYSSYGIKQKEQLKCINCSVETCFALFLPRRIPRTHTSVVYDAMRRSITLLKAETKNPFDSQLHGKNKPEIKLTNTRAQIIIIMFFFITIKSQWVSKYRPLKKRKRICFIR